MDVVLAPLQLLPATIAGVLYALRVHALRRTPRAVPGLRQASFYAGLVVIVATLTLTGRLSDELFAAHMAEHLLIADLGALLLVLGLTGPLLAPVLRVRALAWLRAATHPLVALPLWAVNLYVWHLPALYQGAVENDWVHALEHTLFVACGVAMWMALLGPLPKPAWFGNLARLVYIIVVRLIETVLANVILWSGTVLYPRYAAGERFWHVAPLDDQTAAGAIMMVEGSIVTICAFGWLFLRSARESEERDQLVELAAAHGVELDQRRAARAVAAGQGAALRRRILDRAGAQERVGGPGAPSRPG